jgi:hypothetical protein
MTVHVNTARFSCSVLQLLIALHIREPHNGVEQTIETINWDIVSVVTDSILKAEAEFYFQRCGTYWPSETAQHNGISEASHVNLHSQFKPLLKPSSRYTLQCYLILRSSDRAS